MHSMLASYGGRPHRTGSVPQLSGVIVPSNVLEALKLLSLLRASSTQSGAVVVWQEGCA